MIPSVPARICYSYFKLAGSFKVSMPHENGSKIQGNSIHLSSVWPITMEYLKLLIIMQLHLVSLAEIQRLVYKRNRDNLIFVQPIYRNAQQFNLILDPKISMNYFLIGRWMDIHFNMINVSL